MCYKFRLHAQPHLLIHIHYMFALHYWIIQVEVWIDMLYGNWDTVLLI
jgi:hypothetical protein